MTKFELYCNFVAAKDKADELDNIANKMRKVATDKLCDELQTLSNSWTGEGAEVYRRKGKEMIVQIEMSADNLKKIASTIRTVAERIYNTEMRALQIAQERKS